MLFFHNTVTSWLPHNLVWGQLNASYQCRMFVYMTSKALFLWCSLAGGDNEGEKKPEEDGTDDEGVNNGDAASPVKKDKGSESKKDTSRSRRSRSGSREKRSR